MPKGQGETKRREDQRKKDCVPTNTLFVVNFDPGATRERDLEKYFSKYGKLTRVQIKKNFGFVAFEALDDAIDARVACGNGVRFQGTHMYHILARSAPKPKPICSAKLSLPHATTICRCSVPLMFFNIRLACIVRLSVKA